MVRMERTRSSSRTWMENFFWMAATRSTISRLSRPRSPKIWAWGVICLARNLKRIHENLVHRFNYLRISHSWLSPTAPPRVYQAANSNTNRKWIGVWRLSLP